jgi:hypothetical protein
MEIDNYGVIFVKMSPIHRFGLQFNDSRRVNKTGYAGKAEHEKDKIFL